MRILKLSRYNLQPLEDELDRIGWEKYDIEPGTHLMPSLEDYDDDDEDES